MNPQQALLAKEVLRDGTSICQEGAADMLQSDLPHDPATWTVADVEQWLLQNGFSDYAAVFKEHKVDGEFHPHRRLKVIFKEEDLVRYMNIRALGDVKRIAAKIDLVKQGFHGNELLWWDEPLLDVICKFIFSLVYGVGVFALTAVVMTYVHDRIPDPVKYPPLPDIILDNLPTIPEAFHLTEMVILLMSIIFICVVILHKHRFVLLRRFFALAGACFLLRCVTMFATSLSVPAAHLKCDQQSITVEKRMQHAWRILSGVGASLTGVRTCGDYMFSGHSTLLTLICYFINEYTPTSWEGLHMFTRFCNYFGMLLILIAHEHYTIDVTIAYAFTSRLFLYYHSMANSPRPAHYHLHSFIPLFNYLEKQTATRVPNVYNFPLLSLWRAFSRRYTRGRSPSPVQSRKGSVADATQ